MLVCLAVISLVAIGGGLTFGDWSSRRAISDAGLVIDEGISLARANARRSGVPHLLVLNGHEIAVVDRVVNWARALPSRGSLDLSTGQEIDWQGRPAIAFFGDGSSSGGSITFRMPNYEITRRVNWLDGVVSEK
jgi:Tfp pilus assembly protein FimT